MGIINIIIFLLIMLSYVIYALLHKIKHTTFVWICLGSLTAIMLVTGVSQLVFDDITGQYCNYILDLIYGVCTISLFYIALMTGFKQNMVFFDIEKFMRDSTLPTEKMKR